MKGVALLWICLLGFMPLMSEARQTEKVYPEQYAWLAQGYWIPIKPQDLNRFEERLDSLAAQLPFWQIRLETSYTTGSLPIPKVTIDLCQCGEARKSIDDYIGEPEKLIGKLDLMEYGHLNWLVESMEVLKLKSRYEFGVNHARERVLTIWSDPSSDPITISEWGAAAPIEFWTVVQVIENISTSIEWK